MSKRNQKVDNPRLAKVRKFSEILGDLEELNCTLTCASKVLCDPQDAGELELGAKARTVIYACVERLDRLYNDLDT